MNQLTLPLTDEVQLNKRYESIDTLIKNNHYKKFSNIIYIHNVKENINLIFYEY